LREFFGLFKGIDELVILPIWSAGESKIDMNLEDILTTILSDNGQ